LENYHIRSISGKELQMVSVVINYCSNEKPFLDPLLKECRKFTNDIVVSYGSHLYDGQPEDLEYINGCVDLYKDIKFVKYDVDITMDISKMKGIKFRRNAYWHNLARYTGVQALEKKEWVFIIDADEIPDGDYVREWLESVHLNEMECYKIATYWYFKYPVYQAQQLEDSILLIHYKYLTEENIHADWERDSLIQLSGCKLMREVKGIGGKILWSHFSWCRSRQALLHKIKNWGHASDIFRGVNAEQIVDYIFHNNEVNDVVHGYTYNLVPNRYNISL